LNEDWDVGIGVFQSVRKSWYSAFAMVYLPR
jgi:hypothetical protein